MSAVTQNNYTGNGSTTNYSFTFPYLKASDVKASIDAVDTTAFTLANATQYNLILLQLTEPKSKYQRNQR